MSDKSSTTDEDGWPHFGMAQNKPIVCIIIGMAGSGKTTLIQQIFSHVSRHEIPSYFMNLDPAVTSIPFNANIDIRDSINYKETMKQYKLGPNGAIMTCLNLFVTRFDQVMSFVEKRAPNLKYIFIDTPGQIEVFNWSASGTIITDTLAGAFPTMFIYVADTPRCANPTTFMSNMLYSCSIIYKTTLPLLIAFNKVDVVDHQFCIEWMQDSAVFVEAARTQANYMANFTQSMGFMLEEFYQSLTTVGVSAVTSVGMDEFFEATINCRKEYEAGYKIEYERRIRQREEREKVRVMNQLKKLSLDLGQDELGSKGHVLSLASELQSKEGEVEELESRQEGGDDEDEELAKLIRQQEV